MPYAHRFERFAVRAARLVVNDERTPLRVCALRAQKVDRPRKALAARPHEERNLRAARRPSERLGARSAREPALAGGLQARALHLREPEGPREAVKVRVVGRAPRLDGELRGAVEGGAEAGGAIGIGRVGHVRRVERPVAVGVLAKAAHGEGGR